MWIHRILRKMQRRRTALDIEDQSLLSPSTFLSEYLLLLLLRLMDHGNSIHQSMLLITTNKMRLYSINRVMWVRLLYFVDTLVMETPQIHPPPHLPCPNFEAMLFVFCNPLFITSSCSNKPSCIYVFFLFFVLVICNW